MLRPALLALASTIAACAFDASGLMSDEVLVPGDDAAFDASVALDTGEADSFVVDTSVADALADDAFAADALAGDTLVADSAPTDAGPPPFCDPKDLSLIACWEFEDNGKDGSAYKHDLTITGSTYPKGVGGGKALDLGPGGKALSPNDLNWVLLNTLTVEMWVKLNTLPTGTARVGLLDSEARFGFFVYAPGVLHVTEPEAFESTMALPTKTWTHVAYTYDGLTMTLYVNGASVASKGAIGTFGAGATADPVAVGSNSPSGDVIDGQIDQLRVFKVARTAKQICAAAGTC